MKKYAWMLALALPFAASFTSCGDDEDEIIPDITPDDPIEITLDKSTETVNYQASIKLIASEDGCTWSSDNDFVATVDQKGNVTGNHVGVARITASKEDSQATCIVTVAPTNVSFTLPVITWGASQSDVKDAMRGTSFVLNTSLSDPTTLMYTQPSDAYPWNIYGFTSGKLSSSSLTIELTTGDEIVDLADFLDQYFQMIDSNDDKLEFTYANANNVAQATTVCNLSPTAGFTEVRAVFAPNGTKGVDALEEAVELHNKLAAKLRK